MFESLHTVPLICVNLSENCLAACLFTQVICENYRVCPCTINAFIQKLDISRLMPNQWYFDPWEICCNISLAYSQHANKRPGSLNPWHKSKIHWLWRPSNTISLGWSASGSTHLVRFVTQAPRSWVLLSFHYRVIKEHTFPLFMGLDLLLADRSLCPGIPWHHCWQNSLGEALLPWLHWITRNSP